MLSAGKLKQVIVLFVAVMTLFCIFEAERVGAKKATVWQQAAVKSPNATSYGDYASTKKANPFFKKILPLIQRENNAILLARKRMIALHLQWQQTGRLSTTDQQWLKAQAQHYRLSSWMPKDASQWQRLLTRIDIIPASLALSQAVNESDWGRSRFAREGHNLFGQRCHTKGCGIVPTERSQGETFEVATFKSFRASINRYMWMLNTNRHYQLFRHARAQLRQQGKPLSGTVLAGKLLKYSSRKAAYIATIRGIISHYKLSQYDQA